MHRIPRSQTPHGLRRGRRVAASEQRADHGLRRAARRARPRDDRALPRRIRRRRAGHALLEPRPQQSDGLSDLRPTDARHRPDGKRDQLPRRRRSRFSSCVRWRRGTASCRSSATSPATRRSKRSGRYATEHGLMVSAFYLSNVEQYLIGRDGGFDEYAREREGAAARQHERDHSQLLRPARHDPPAVRARDAGTISTSMIEPIDSFAQALSPVASCTATPIWFSTATSSRDATRRRPAIPRRRSSNSRRSETRTRSAKSVPTEDRWPVRLAAMLRARGLSVADPEDHRPHRLDDRRAVCGNRRRASRGPFDLVTLAHRRQQPVSRTIGRREYRAQFRALLESRDGVRRREAGVARDRASRFPDWGVTPFAQGRDRATDRRARSMRFNAVNRDEDEPRPARITSTSRRSPVARPPSRALVAADGLHPSADDVCCGGLDAILPIVLRASV